MSTITSGLCCITVECLHRLISALEDIGDVFTEFIHMFSNKTLISCISQLMARTFEFQF